MITANDIADYFLWFFHKHGDCLTNLKLQKLIYYAQAWYLALFNRELFNEPIQAWVHGPVVYSVYNRFKHYGWRDIEENPQKPAFDEITEDHLIEVIEVYGDWTAYELEKLAHSELPWIEARGDLPPDEASTNIINPNTMSSYYSKLAKE